MQIAEFQSLISGDADSIILLYARIYFSLSLSHSPLSIPKTATVIFMWIEDNIELMGLWRPLGQDGSFEVWDSHTAHDVHVVSHSRACLQELRS